MHEMGFEQTEGPANEATFGSVVVNLSDNRFDSQKWMDVVADIK